MVKIVPANENLKQEGVKIGIQAVKEDGTPVGKEIQLSTYPVEIGRANDEGIKGISEHQRAIRGRDGKDITPVDYVVARYPEGVNIIEGIYGRWGVSDGTDATHRSYLKISPTGNGVIIAYAKENLFPVKVRDENGFYTLPSDKKIVLEKGEEVYLHLSGTYTKVGEAPSGAWIMEPAWLKIRVLRELSKELYS